MDYDLGDRVTRKTSGTDIAQFLVGGASDETYQYSSRGLPFSIASSYGPVITSTHYDLDGAVNRVQYGDAASTQATFTRDERRRLTEYKLSRGAPSLWKTEPTGTYPTPAAATTPLILADFVFPSADIDAVGNPTRIEDHAALTVPDHAAAVATKTVRYDDLYRTTLVSSTYANGGAAWQSPYQAELSSGDRRPVPLQYASTRVRSQSFGYDALGNVIVASSDQNMPYDRSLGATTQGTATAGPNQLRTADGIRASYDDAGTSK